MSVSQVPPSAAKKALLSDRVYTTLKHSATTVLPAISTLYFALAQIWDLPNAEKVVGSIAAVNAFIGILVGVSTRSYNNSDDKYAGVIEVTDTGTKKVYSLNLNTTPEDLEAMTDATFKVSDTGSTPLFKQ